MNVLAIITCIWLSAATTTIALPPLMFDHDYKGILSVVLVDANKIHAYCKGGPMLVTGRTMACAVLDKDHCVIVLPNVESGIVSQPQQDRLRHHEIGHCNGWPGDHAGSIYTMVH